MTDDATEVTALQAALGARTRMQHWASGAELIILLRELDRAGWLDALAGGTSRESLADIGGVTVDRAVHITDVLVAAGVATSDQNGSVVLTAEFAALHAGASGVTLSVVLDALDADRTRLHGALDITDIAEHESSTADALAVARNWGVYPTAASRVLFGLAYESVPQYRDRLAGAGRLLDVGSGVGGALLTTLTLFPGLSAVGIEHAGDVVAELAERGRAAGVADRLEVRHAPAQDLEDAAAFDACYWAQAFFAPEFRRPVLAAIRRALVPGGLLLVQELAPAPDDDASATLRAGLDGLIANTRGLPPVRRAEELAEELTAAGFDDAEVAVSPVGRLVLAHAPWSPA